MKVLEKHMEQSIQQVAGKEALPIYNALKGKENVNEFTLVEELEMNINQIRNILYKLDNHGLLESKRKKDRKKGWYIYFWTLKNDKLKQLVIKLKKDRLNFLERKLNEEQENDFYICPNNCMRVDANQALEQGYMCEECGQLLEHEDSQKLQNRIKREIKEIEEELATKEEEELKVKEETVKEKITVKRATKKVKKKVAKKKVKKKSTKKKTVKRATKKVKKKVAKKKVKKK